MRVALLLLAHSFRRTRTLILSTGLLLGAFQLVLIAVAGSIQNQGGFEQLAALIPPFARELLGPSMVSFLSFSGIVCLGYFHLASMGSLVGLTIALATTPASEVETGFIDLILSRPVARHWIITRTIAMAVLATVFLLGLMIGGTWIGLKTLAPNGVDWPTPTLVCSLALNLGLLMLCWSGIALVIAAASRRRSIAGALAGLLALATFLLDYVGRLWSPAESVAWISPFRYFSPFDLLMGTPLPMKNLEALFGIALAGWALAYAVFRNRDISH